MPPSYSRASKPSQPQALTPLKRTAAGLSASISKENSPSRAQAIAAGGARPSAKRFKSTNGAAMACPSTTTTTQPSQHQLAQLDYTPRAEGGAGGDKGGKERGGEKESATAASLASKKEREAKQASLARDEEEFVSKYTKAFPSFVFHFDSVQPGSAESKILDLGGRIDKFFSKYVTHVISSRPVPVPNDKENAPPSTKAILAAADPRRGAIMDARTLIAVSRAPRPPVNPFLDEGGPSDVLQKAVSFKMKIWDLKKLNSVLSRLTTSSKPSTSRTTSQRPSQSSLSHLLADEKIHGTRERDLTAPRPDYHYFTKGSFFVLCEDATGEYRTVLAKEYDRPRGGETPEWPVLHGNFLKASTSAPVKMEPVEHKLPPLQKKQSTTATASASKLPIGLSAKTRLAAVRENAAAGDLRRSASLNNLSKTAKLVAEEERLLALANEGPNDEAGVDRPYIAASGNSVGITSTITSAQSGTGHGGGGNNAAAMKRDQRRVVELPRKVVPVVSGLRGLAPSRMTDQSKVELLPSASISTGKGANDEDQKMMIDLDSTPAEADEEEMVVVVEGAPGPAVESRKRKHMADHVHRTLAGKVAGRMDPPPPIKKRYSFPGALPRREKSMVRLPPREENKKPGYCENCRVKFDDFSEHIVSRKHRRFALNTAHFKDLDTVLDRLIREPARRAPTHVVPPPYKPAVRRPESDSEDEASEEEEEQHQEQQQQQQQQQQHQQQEAEQSEEVVESEDEEVVPQWVLEEQEQERRQLSEEARRREAEEEEVDEIDEEEEDEEPLEVDMGDEDEE
ncbi:Dfp1/Him1, central region-domain-containing protein [Mrakia frigida]|uniref:Dfp1/Him1, central region-domain-containing protein n=1 Tax=Mrakia frigida TaxID=29902 RepID=UPI003FCC1001